MTKEELWKAVLGEMELSLSKANFTTWFKNTSILANEGVLVIVGVPNGFIKEWLENKFHKQILTSIQTFSPEIREIKYTIGNSLPQSTIKKDFSQFITERVFENKQPADINPQTNLNKKYW